MILPVRGRATETPARRPIPANADLVFVVDLKSIDN